MKENAQQHLTKARQHPAKIWNYSKEEMATEIPKPTAPNDLRWVKAMMQLQKEDKYQRKHSEKQERAEAAKREAEQEQRWHQQQIEIKEHQEKTNRDKNT